MSETGYEERYCLFLDILGFESHVDDTLNLAQGTKRPMTFQKLRGALHAITAGTQYKDSVLVKGGLLPSSRQVSQFSDSVVVSYLRNEPFGSGITSIILDVHRLQLNLIRKGILLRGAITVGRLFHDEDHVFGPALNEAARLEKLVNYPRVILDRQVLEDADLLESTRLATDSPDGSILSMITEDFDGLHYVDYINVHPLDFDDKWSDLREYLDSLRDLIKRLSDNKVPSIRIKHSWLRSKFNAMSLPLQNSSFQKLGDQVIPEDEVDMFRSIRPF